MAVHKLTARKVQTAAPGKHEDGGGLRLIVSKADSRKWVLRYTCHGKRREMGLGAFPDVGLAEARAKASEARKLAKSGVDPIGARLAEAAAIPTFTTCAARYIRAHRRGWRNRKHTRQWISTLRTYAVPVLGDARVDQISTEMVLSCLSGIWHCKNETAKRVQGRIENILDYASAHKYRDPLNPARWRGHLDKLLPKPSRVQNVRHHPAMPYDEVSGFMRELGDSISAHALRFLILTATRTGEVLGARWDEIDGDVWTVPAERMKARHEHRVPLPPIAVELLNALPRFADNPYIFPGARKGRPLSNMALLKVMRDRGFGVGGDRGDYVPHGFRSSFRDWAGEVSSFPRDVCEMALAHTIPDKVEAAYRRGDLFAKRREMMNAWANYIAERGANVLPLKKNSNKAR